jgi:hypothetical protein
MLPPLALTRDLDRLRHSATGTSPHRRGRCAADRVDDRLPPSTSPWRCSTGSTRRSCGPRPTPRTASGCLRPTCCPYLLLTGRPLALSELAGRLWSLVEASFDIATSTTSSTPATVTTSPGACVTSAGSWADLAALAVDGVEVVTTIHGLQRQQGGQVRLTPLGAAGVRQLVAASLAWSMSVEGRGLHDWASVSHRWRMPAAERLLGDDRWVHRRGCRRVHERAGWSHGR